jgi:CRP-like cAMP-binding protein
MEKADLVRTREILKKQTWLHGHGADLVEPLLAHARLVTFQAGQWTHAEGDEETGILIVIRGLAYVLCKAPGDREVLIIPRNPGDAIGQTTRFGGGPRLVTVQCIDDSLILLASDRVLTQIAMKRPQIWQAVAALCYLQARDLLLIVADLIALPPRQRLAARIARLAQADEQSGKIVLSLSQEALAEMVGLTRKTVNGYLAEFEREGLIQRTYGSVILLDPQGLQRIAES